MVTVMRAIATSLSELFSVIGNLLIEKPTQPFHSPSSNTNGLDLISWCRTTSETRHPDCQGKRGRHREPDRLPTQCPAFTAL